MPNRPWRPHPPWPHHRTGPWADHRAWRHKRTPLFFRFVFGFGFIVLLMLGLPFALSGRGSTTFRSIGLGVFLCFAYYVADAFCLSMGVGGTLPPAAAAWLPVLVFGPLGFFLLDSVPT